MFFQMRYLRESEKSGSFLCALRESEKSGSFFVRIERDGEIGLFYCAQRSGMRIYAHGSSLLCGTRPA